MRLLPTAFRALRAILIFWCGPLLHYAARVVQALRRYGFTKGEFEEIDFITTPNFLSFSRQEVWIDLMTQLAGVTFEECAADALTVETDAIPVRYINLVALRKAKAATSRPQDLQDLLNLPPAPTS